MHHSTTISSNTHILSNRIVTVITTFALAVLMLAGVGFIQGTNGAVHNAAHDTRHIMNFPCH